MVKLSKFKVTYGSQNSQAVPLPAPKDSREDKAGPKNSFRFHIKILKPLPDADGSKELSVSQFADEAGVTPQAVRKMIAEGRLQARKLGNQYIIRIDELYKYFAMK